MVTVTLERARAELDAQIASLEAHLKQLKARRNALSATAKLPTEILGAIFLHCKKIHEGSHRGFSKWMRVSFVCRRWRETALAIPKLWEVISINWGTKHISAVLERSAAVPLTVRGKLLKENKGQLSQVLQHSARLRKVDLDTSDAVISWFLAEATQPAPLLTKLYLRDLEYVHGDPEQELRMNLFKKITPNLRFVSIIGLSVDLSSSIFSGLTTLKLTRLVENFRPPCEHFYAALRSCPSLKHLCIKEMYPIVHDGFQATGTPGQISKLLHLRTLEVVDQLEYCSHFLSHLEFPQSTTMDVAIVIFSEDEAVEEYPTLLTPILARMYPSSNRSCYRAIDIVSGRDSDQVTLQWNRSQKHVSNSMFTIKATGMEQDSIAATVKLAFVVLCAELPLQYARSLSLDYDGLRAGDWHAAFAHATELKDIRIIGTSVLGMVAATRGLAWCLEQVPRTSVYSVGQRWIHLTSLSLRGSKQSALPDLTLIHGILKTIRVACRRL